MEIPRSLQQAPTSVVSDALDRLCLPGVLPGLPRRAGGRLVGFAFPVAETCGALGTFPLEDFRIGEVIEAAPPGHVIVLAAGGRPVSTWGELAAQAALRRGLAGVVTDAAVRDLEALEGLGLPVFARHLAPTSGKTRIRVGALGQPVHLAGHRVEAGDLLVGDATGLCVVPRARLQEVARAAEEILRAEEAFARALEAGETFRQAGARLRHL